MGRRKKPKQISKEVVEQYLGQKTQCSQKLFRLAWVVAAHRVAPRPPLQAFTGHSRGKFYSKNYRMGQRDGTRVKALLYL